jgi:hypothetical protein
MATCRNISGNWRAVYHYSPNPQLPYLPPVRFALTLKQGWFGRFTGTSVDEPNGVPGVGGIEGRLAGSSIKFVRQMSECFVFEGHLTVSLRDYLTSLGESCDFELPVPPIYYAGQFADGQLANGTWTIPETIVKFPDGHELIIDVTIGTWAMERDELTSAR